MAGFRWDPKTFTLAEDRFEKLAGHGEEYLSPMLSEHVANWAAGGLLDLLVIHHRSLSQEVVVSAGCTPAMLRKINENLGAVAEQYTASDNAAAEDISKTWDQMGFDLPASGDPNLERHGGMAYDFGSGLPPSDQPGWGDYAIQDLVNTILGLPKSVVIPDLSLKNPVLKAIWDAVFRDWLEMSEFLSHMLTGDWEGVYKAGDAMSNAGAYWLGLSEMSRYAAGTLFRGWDGEASEHAERFVGKICDLYGDAAQSIWDCGRDYKDHAHGCYLVFSELNGILTGIPSDLSLLFELLDEADKAIIPVILTGIYEVAMKVFENIAKVIGKVLLVLQLIEAVVGIVLAAVTLFTNYSNEMRGALD